MMLGVITRCVDDCEVSDLLQQARGQLANIISKADGGWWYSYLFFVAWATIMASIAAATTSELHPQAAGSGIPQLKVSWQVIMRFLGCG